VLRYCLGITLIYICLKIITVTVARGPEGCASARWRKFPRAYYVSIATRLGNAALYATLPCAPRNPRLDGQQYTAIIDPVALPNVATQNQKVKKIVINLPTETAPHLEWTHFAHTPTPLHFAPRYSSANPSPSPPDRITATITIHPEEV